MVAETDGGKVALFSRNGKIISHSYMEVARALEAVKGDAVIDGELVALDKAGVSHFNCCRTRFVTKPGSFTARSTSCFLTVKIYAPCLWSNAKSG
jgi:ATP-dependent DNA ligase